ncbi:ABC transporter substrate-binding protein [Phytohabitans suffuscus]|uniref:Sugar ABC transporter substrate-binding protein n=1 Tax=Phytohabitans suffuscus TaxID=624315 RepID=A0A6F8YUG5_9ACTN|nr:sugar ABC transporter substrate-binding protein [Phytohabitans suffuscus]BCB89578.1 sugar ABC transporter substrate-binding protein [Phytohabitans suffuscus]
MSVMPLSRRQLLRAAGLAGGFTLLAPALASCGGGGDTEALAADAAAEPKGVTLRLMVNQPHVTAFTKILADRWAAETGGKIEVTAVPYDQLTSKQILDVQGGAGEFDVFDYFYFGLGALVDAGALVDLTDWIGGQSDLDAGDFLPSIYDPYTLYEGRRYGLPYDGDLHILFYNKEIFDRHGLRPPATWDEYDAAAKKITQEGGGAYYGAIVQGQQVPMILGCSFINRLAGYGGTLVDGSGAPTLTSDAAVAAAEHLIAVSPHALPTPLQIGFDQANTAFLSGQGAMIDTWTDMSLRADDPSVSKIAGKWGVVSLPVGGTNTTPRTALDAGFGLGVSSASRHKPEAAAFVKWATAAQQNLSQASTAGAGIDPNRRSVLHSAEYAKATPTAAQVIRQNLDGSPLVWPKAPSAPKILQDLVDQLALAVQGQQDARTALRRAQESWERELSR